MRLQAFKRIECIVIAACLSLAVLSSCAPMPRGLSIDAAARHQTIEGFGASAAWWAQDIGGWTQPDKNGKETREAILELLYSPTAGIGMHIYRYNLGAGTGTGEKPGEFEDSWRSGQSFIDDNGEIDYTLDANAQWCMRKAVELGAEEVVFFSNSAPDSMTITGMPHSHEQKKRVTNLAPENYLPFAQYSLDAVQHFLKEGLPVTAISPINEPQWRWQGGQEGCHYEPDEMVALYKVFYEEMARRGLTNSLELSMFESGQWGGNKFKKYFNAIMQDETLRSVMGTIDGHSYNSSTADKARTAKWLDKKYPQFKRRCTEWVEMTGGTDVTMDSALIMANMICDDLTVLDAVSWSYWIAVASGGWRDGLIYVDVENRTYTTTKRLYAYGNFTKFIRPGAQRVEAVSSKKDTNCVSFVNPDGSLVTVLVNSSAKEQPLPFQLQNSGTYTKIHQYLTDASHDVTLTSSAPYVPNSQILLPAQSVTTLVLEP